MDRSFLIVGLGSIGRCHLRCLRSIEPDSKIIIWHQRSENPKIPQDADAVVFRLEDALAYQPFAAIIANPASCHIETAMSLVSHGIHMLVEKPLSNTLEHVDQLLAACEKQKCILMVAYALRSSESLCCLKSALDKRLIGRILSVRSEVGQYLPDWRPDTDYRQSVSARSELGGGALLELSHELDYIQWMFGKILTVQAKIMYTGVLDINVEDLVELTLDVRGDQGNKILVSLHLDMLQRPASRSCRVVGANGILEWNGINHSVRYYDVTMAQWHLLCSDSPVSRDAMFIKQLKDFLHSVEMNQEAKVTGRDGEAVLKVIAAARASAASHMETLIP